MRPVIEASLPVNPVRNSRLKLAHGQIFWREVGDGHPVICLHDAWQDGEDWQPWLTQLGQSCHGLAPDLLGFGNSSAAIAPTSIALEVEALMAWIDTLRFPSVTLIGHGLGGWIAATLALRHPDRVRTLILITPEGVMPKALAGRWRSARWLAGRWSLLASGLRLLRPIATLLGQGQALQRGLAYRQQLRRSPTACRLLFRRRRAEIQAELLTEGLAQITPPTWLIQGNADARPQQLLTEAYAQGLPQAQRLTVAGHSTPTALAQSPEFMAQLDVWLQSR